MAECFANLECKMVHTQLVDKYNLFVVEVVKAWIDPAQQDPKGIHHRGYGTFVVADETIKLQSKNALGITNRHASAECATRIRM